MNEQGGSSGNRKSKPYAFFVVMVTAFSPMVIAIISLCLSDNNFQSLANDHNDMILSQEQLDAIAGKKNVLLDEKSRWPNGIVYYRFSKSVSEPQRDDIRSAMSRIEEFAPCVKFKPYKHQSEGYLTIANIRNYGCSAQVGYTGDPQFMNLYYDDCFAYGAIAHELLHVLGFHHEHCATDRDKYVTIMWENVIEHYKSQFRKLPPNMVENLGVSYDYDSVMHYPKTAGSKNGRPTIVPKKKNVQIGLYKELSKGDVKRLRLMYGC